MIKNFVKGLLKENPIFVMMLGLCPALGVTTTAYNALGMGVATTIVLISSNVVISFLKNFIPEKVRIPCYIVIIASMVTVIQLYIKAYLPRLDAALGIFIPLIIVNCLILGRAEGFASKNSSLLSFFDGFGMGLGFTLGLLSIGICREFLGYGEIFGLKILPENVPSLFLFALPPGAFLVLGYLIAVFNKFYLKKGS